MIKILQVFYVLCCILALFVHSISIYLILPKRYVVLYFFDAWQFHGVYRTLFESKLALIIARNRSKKFDVCSGWKIVKRG